MQAAKYREKFIEMCLCLYDNIKIPSLCSLHLLTIANIGISLFHKSTSMTMALAPVALYDIDIMNVH